MVEITLADGCPVWEGAALTCPYAQGRLIVTKVSASHFECVGEGYYDSIGGSHIGYRLDLTHRPTALELAARCVDLLPRHSCAEMSEDGTVSTWANGERTDYTDIKALYRELVGAA